MWRRDITEITLSDSAHFTVSDCIAIRQRRHWFWRRVLAPVAALLSHRWAERLRWWWAQAYVTGVDRGKHVLTINWTQEPSDATP